MSSKLDQPLDELAGSRRGRRNTQRRRTSIAKVRGAPVGGIKKNTKNLKPIPKATPTGPAAGTSESKIIVTGLVWNFPLSNCSVLSMLFCVQITNFSQPSDVDEANIKVC